MNKLATFAHLTPFAELPKTPSREILGPSLPRTRVHNIPRMEKRPPRADRETLEYYERGKERDRLDDPRGIRRERALVVVLAFVVLALSALALWLYLSGKPPAHDSPAAGFARDMMVHHAQAVEMAEIVRDRTENPQIRILATDIALTQQAQIGQMQGWLAVWGLPPTGDEKPMAWMGHPVDGAMPGMATPEEIDRLRELPTGKGDELFLRLMIPHHVAAIPMARAVIERGDEPEVELFAEKVIAHQQAEIENMQEMLKAMGAAPVEGHPSMDGMHGAGSDHHH
jgi:uncharacterized protein (DUF305 family)